MKVVNDKLEDKKLFFIQNEAIALKEMFDQQLDVCGVIVEINEVVNERTGELSSKEFVYLLTTDDKCYSSSSAVVVKTFKRLANLFEEDLRNGRSFKALFKSKEVAKGKTYNIQFIN